MRKDNIFYTEQSKLLQSADPELKPETVTYQELYERWLRPTLLATPPIKSYPKSLVDFAELLLESPRADTDWFHSASMYRAKSILGLALQKASVTGETRKFSSAALAFAGYKFEVGYVANEDPRGIEPMCNELIIYMGWVPRYFRIDKERKILRGTKVLRREAGLPVWLPYQSVW